MALAFIGISGVQSAVAWLAQTYPDICSSNQPLASLRKTFYLYQTAMQAHLVYPELKHKTKMLQWSMLQKAIKNLNDGHYCFSLSGENMPCLGERK